MKKDKLRQIIKESISESSHSIALLKRTSNWIIEHKDLPDSLIAEVESWDEDYVNETLSSKEFKQHLIDNGWGQFTATSKAEFIDELEDLKYSTIKLEDSTNKIVWDILYDTKGDINMIDLDDNDWNKIEIELKKVDDFKQNKISQDIELIVDAMPIAMQLVKEEYAVQLSDLAKERIMPIVGASIIKKHRRKLGKKHTGLEDRNKRIAEALKPYWDYRVNDITMPNNHNRDSLFYMIAEKENLSFERIKQIERELRDKYAPKELDWNDDYPNKS